MKKLLLVSAIATFSLNSFAQNPETGCPYIKGHIGVIKAQNTSDVTNQIYKSNPTIMGTLALGYNLKDNLRLDLSLDHYPNLRLSTNNDALKIDVKLKTSIVLFNLYMDIAEIRGYKVFIGAGAGTSRFSVKGQVLDKTSNQTFPIRYTESDEFAYGLYAGTHYEYAPGVHGELMYSYKDLGQVNDSKFKTHNITAGFRFDL
jgi:opacity protein-like surface antigen